MRVINLAQCPPPSVRADASVMEAVRVMQGANVGAAAVVEGDQLVGVVSERDVMLRVVAEKRDPERTLVRDVMSTPVKTVSPETGTEDALALMVSNHIRHVLIVNEKGCVVGLASIRNVYQAQVESLDDQVHTLTAYVGCDCPGG